MTPEAPVDLNDLHRSLGRIESKLDALSARDDAHKERLDHHSNRLRSLERGRSWLMGAAAGISAVVTFALAEAKDSLSKISQALGMS